MARTAVSLTIEEAHLLWLKGVTERSGARSVSETVNRLIASARETDARASAGARSVVGTIDLGDPALADADSAIHELFAESLARPVTRHPPRGARPRAMRRG